MIQRQELESLPTDPARQHKLHSTTTRQVRAVRRTVEIGTTGPKLY